MGDNRLGMYGLLFRGWSGWGKGEKFRGKDCRERIESDFVGNAFRVVN